MADKFELKGVYSIVGLPTFTNESDFKLAEELARLNPYYIRWDKWVDRPYITSPDVTLLDTYGRLYGQDAVDKLLKSISATTNGLLVVSYSKDFVFNGATFFPPDPQPEVVAGIGESLIKTPWGNYTVKVPAAQNENAQDVMNETKVIELVNSALATNGTLVIAVEKIAARVAVEVLNAALNIK